VGTRRTRRIGRISTEHLAVFLLASALAFGFFLLPALHGDPPSDLPDPIPLNRVWLTPDRLPREMDRAKQGVLIKLPRDAFEELVRQAAQAEASRKNPPRLIEAHYHAELADGALVGSCQWKVVHNAVAPGLLPLAPLNLALRQPRFENGDALIADFDGHEPSLLVETPGDHSASAEWSARAEARPEGLQFDLRFPACPVAVLELDLPIDKIAVVDDGGLSGPRPAGPANLNRWTIACGGRSQVGLWIRSRSQAPVLRASLSTTQVLSPEGQDISYSFFLKSFHQGVRELVFECDADLRPYQVIAPGLDKWEVAPAAADAPAVVLNVHLSQPLEEGTVQILCLAPLDGATGGAKPVVWTSPAIRLRQSISGGETLIIKVHPDLRMETLDPGGFHLKEAVTEQAADPHSGFRQLTFLGGGVNESGLATETAGRRPQAKLAPHEVTFRARQLAWWRVDPTRSALTLQITYDVRYGQLFQLTERLPPGWEVQSVTVAPERLLRNWRIRPEKEGPVLVVDLQRPLTITDKPTPHTPTLTVKLKPAQAGVLGKELPFPDAFPIGAQFREGSLAIAFDERTDQLAVKTAAVEAPPDDDGPWEKDLPTYYYPYRAQQANSNSPVAGVLTLRPRPPRIRAQCTSDVVLSTGRATVDTRLLLEAEQGSPNSVDLYVSAPCVPTASGDPWGWRAERGGVEVKEARRMPGVEAAAALAALGAADVLGVAAVLAGQPRGECWRVTFARPLRVREPILLHGALTPRIVDDERHDIPLTAVLGASRMEGEATVRLAAAHPLQVEAFGLREASPEIPNHPRGASAWRIFRYNGPAVGLTLRGPLQDADRAAEAAVERAALTTYIRPDGILEHHFVFHASHWQQRTLPLQLPVGARLLMYQVDGIWSPWPVVAEDAAGKPVVNLPAPTRAREPSSQSGRRYEVVYTTTAPIGWLWTRVEAPVPSLPVEPAVFQRSWRLPPEFSPLADNHLLRLPGPGEGTSAAAEAYRPEDLFRAAPIPAPPFGSWFQGREEAGRREALSDALLGLRGKTEQTRPLGAVLVDTAAALRKMRQSLVLDATALGEASVGPATVVVIKPQSAEDAAPPWDDLGLTALVTRSGWLLTTRRQLEAWQKSGGAPVPSEEVDSANADAASWGRDVSERFQAAPVWSDSMRKDKNPLPSPQDSLVQWTEWTPLAGAGDDDVLLLVRRPYFEAGGWALTALLGLSFLAAGWRWKRVRLGLLLLWLAVSGLGLLWLPAAAQGLAWPALLAGCACALVWRLRSGAILSCSKAWFGVRKHGPQVTAGAGAVLVLLTLVAWGRPSDSTAPAPATVFIAPGPADAPDKHFVLAPPQLLERLHTLTRPSGAPGAVLLKADYTGKVVEGAVEFDAAFQVYCFTDETTKLTLPLDGVQLTGDILLDGAPVQAAALPAPQAGFTIPVAGRSKTGEPPHKLELHFRTPVTGTAEERNIQFTAPRLAQSHLLLRLPKGSAYIQALVKYGIQKPAADGDPYSLDVELGRVSAPLHLRWVPETPGAPKPRLPEVRLKEAYLWDLRLDSSSLTAFLSYTISSEGTASLEVKVPMELEVLTVAARRPRDATALRLRNWKVTGAGPARTLQMEFASPVSGDIEVLLEMAPRSPWPPSFVLPLPSPILPSPTLPQPSGEGREGGKPGRATASFLAYRTDGLEVERVNPVGVTGVDPEQFAPFWAKSSWLDPRPPTYASTILRDDENHPPVLGLKVRPSSPASHAKVDVEIHVGPRQADVRATAVLTARGDLPLVQWQIRSTQPFTVIAVTGANVRRWSQEGDRVLVWLEPPGKSEGKGAEAPSLQMTGWLPLSSGPNGMSLEMPCLRLSSAETQETTVRLIVGNELSLTEVGVRNLTAVDPMEAGKIYTAGDKTDYGGAWRIHTGPAEVHIVTIAGMRERKLTFTAVADCRPAYGNVQALGIRVRNWAGKVRIDAAPSVRQSEQRRGPDDRVWLLEQGPGARGPLRVTVVGDEQTETSGGAVMPDVTVLGSAHAEQWVAVTGSELTAEPSGGLMPMEDARGQPTPILQNMLSSTKAWHTGAGPVWKITSPEWRLNLAPRDAASTAAPIEVFLAEYRTAVADGGRWLHEAVYWLRHEANTDLNLTFPADAEVLSVGIDDAETAPLQAEPRRLWMPLTGRPAVCRVRVRWKYAAEDLDRPNLDAPTLQGAREDKAVWTVFVPAGWEAEGPTRKNGLRHGLMQAAALSWQRAEAQLHMSAVLAARAAEGAGAVALAETQRRFYAECRRTKQALEVAPTETGSAWPAGRSPLESLQDLRQKNKELAETRHFEAIRAAAERQGEEGEGEPETTPVWEGEGRPLYARRDGAEQAPGLTLTATELGRRQTAWALTWTWMGILLLVGLLSLLWPATALLRIFWPEQIGLVGLVGLWTAGATLIVVSLLLLAVGARALIVMVEIGRFFRRPPPNKPKSTANLPAVS
jgi:hypothetical protein